MVKFTEAGHSYTSTDGADIQWTSVTTAIHHFTQPFDSPKIALKSSKNKKSKWYGMTVEAIETQWKETNTYSLKLGTWYHKLMEDSVLSHSSIVVGGQELQIISPIMEAGEKLAPVQKLLNNTMYPEHLTYLKSVGIIGQSDLIEVVDGYLNVGDFKGLALGTSIPTEDGFKLMKDIIVGDRIFDGDGKITTVEHVSEVHHNPCYEMKFDTNDTIVCDHEHKWVTTDRVSSGSYKTPKYQVNYVPKTKTTEEIYNLYTLNQPVRFQCTTSLDTLTAVLPIDPYVLGTWLGDGSKQCGAITNMNPRTWEEIEKRGYTLGNDISNQGCGLAQTRTILGMYTALREMNLLMNKHIPIIYLRSSHDQRLDLLRGLMDSDGHYHKKRKRCVMNTTQQWQADATMELVSSLGWKPTLIKTLAQCGDKKDIPAFHVTFMALGQNPFLSRNDDYLSVCVPYGKKDNIKAKYRYLKSIERVATEATKCIAVSSPLSTYLFSKNYIPTHNTNKEIKFESYKNWEGMYQMMKPPFQHVMDCNFKHYNLQLSLYAYMILKHNPQLKMGKITIKHILFEVDHCDQFDNPIYKLDEQGNFIVTKTIDYDLPYMKAECQLMMNYLQTHKIPAKHN